MMLRALFVALLVCGAPALAGEPAAGAGLDARIAKLVRELGDNDWQVRTRAAGELRKIGAPALAAVKAAAASPDQEVKARATELLAQITRDLELAFVGNVLIAEPYAKGVSEIDKNNEAAWELAAPDAVSAQRLPDGRTLVARAHWRVSLFAPDGKEKELRPVKGRESFWYAEAAGKDRWLVCVWQGGPKDPASVIEIDADGKTVWEVKAETPNTCQRLTSGNTLIAQGLPGTVIEVDKEGKTVWKLEGLKQPGCAQRLANGHTLVVERGARAVREFDAAGKEVWKFSENLRSPIDAWRLPNGHTLVTDYLDGRVIQIDKDGKQVWERKGLKNPYRARPAEPPAPPEVRPPRKEPEPEIPPELIDPAAEEL